ncbi:MAG: hypothetical protein ACKVQW_00045 [Pyrinomonadaceae bacterium]
MGQKPCDKCGELVDEAKAFCPACGNAFVEEEQRKEESAFEQMDSTVQMGKTMYGQMLSDMGLNISKAPDATPPPPEKRVEVIAPLTTTATPAAAVTPISRAQTEPAVKKSYVMWIVLGVAALIVGLAVLVVIVAAVFVYLNRLA